MTMMKKLRKAAPRLRKGASDKEIIRWAKRHDVFDRLDAGVSALVDDRSDLVTFRKEILDSLKKVAGKGGVERIPASTPKLMRTLKTAEHRIKSGLGIKHRDFWRAVPKK
jgi:hypothetical protein